MLLLPALTFLLATCQAQREGNTSVSESIDDITLSTDAEQILHRNAEIISRLAETPAQGVRKMSTDEGEKFFLDYWQFLDNVQGISERETSDETMDDETPEVFLERSFPLQPPSLPSDLDNPLHARDFKCPTGTYGCTSIGRPNRCCGAGETLGRHALDRLDHASPDTRRAPKGWVVDAAFLATSVSREDNVYDRAAKYVELYVFVFVFVVVFVPYELYVFISHEQHHDNRKSGPTGPSYKPLNRHYGRGILPDWVLCLLGRLPWRVLPDRSRLRYHVMSYDIFDDAHH
ncbi:uncharacterized protein PFLUO_LOCUS7732 [Penicillium psychrofluorescens]|uniref:uncharacterized protein n=1 Tax=Penicillium psychrofluorescens TaxID=3158075 RepID=UPI003CCE4218